jgi:F420-non-reducing hydrogenase iron-sulfur subunit
MGAKGVLVGGCSIGACHYVNGNVKAQNRVRLTRRVIQPLGINPSQLRIEWIGSKEPAKLVRILNEMNQ